MIKFSIKFFLLLYTLSFAETWEANLERCKGFGGFWFPNHNWTDRGEPWIKPFGNDINTFFSEDSLNHFGEPGLYFNYSMPGWEPSAESPLDVDNELLIRRNQSNIKGTDEDSIFFYSKCGISYSENKTCSKKMYIEDVIPENFKLVQNKQNSFYIDTSLFHLESFYYNYAEDSTGIYFIYKKYYRKLEYAALCNLILNYSAYGNSSSLETPFYKIQCVFQDDGTLNFDKIPNANSISKEFCTTNSSLKIQKKNKVKDFFYQSLFFKVNGTFTSEGSSNIIIKNNQPTLQLKGGH